MEEEDQWKRKTNGRGDKQNMEQTVEGLLEVETNGR